MRLGEVLWCPALNRMSDILLGCDENGENDQHGGRVAEVESVCEVVVTAKRRHHLARRRHQHRHLYYWHPPLCVTSARHQRHSAIKSNLISIHQLHTNYTVRAKVETEALPCLS